MYILSRIWEASKSGTHSLVYCCIPVLFPGNWFLVIIQWSLFSDCQWIWSRCLVEITSYNGEKEVTWKYWKWDKTFIQGSGSNFGICYPEKDLISLGLIFLISEMENLCLMVSRASLRPVILSHCITKRGYKITKITILYATIKLGICFISRKENEILELVNFFFQNCIDNGRQNH